MKSNNIKAMKAFYSLYLDFLTEQITDTAVEIRSTHKQEDFDLLDVLLEEFSVVIKAYAGEFRV